VVLALPEDMLLDPTTVEDARAAQAVRSSPAAQDIVLASELLASAERPLIIVGGSDWSDTSRLQLQQFATASGIPVVNSFRCQDFFDNEHPNYAGDLGIGVNPDLYRLVEASDCLLVIGSRLGEMTTGGFSLIDIPCPKQKMIHVHPGADELGHVYQPDLAINAGSQPFVAALAEIELESSPSTKRQQLVSSAHQQYLDWNRSITVPGDVQFSDIIHSIREHTDSDAILCNGAGNNTSWLHRFFRYRQYRNQLAPANGTMGYGLPAAVAAKLSHPDRCVIAVAGDGDYLMTGQELATAMQYRANIIVIVVNNGIYATIRMHQERDYPARVHGTALANPDFAALARAYGAHGETGEKTEDFAPALDRALDAGRCAVIELRIDPEAITTRTTLGAIREKALASHRG